MASLSLGQRRQHRKGGKHGGAPDGVAIAGKDVALGNRFMARPDDGQVNQPDGLVFGASTRAGDARHRDGEIGP